MYMDAADDNLPGVLAPKLLYAVSGDTVSVRVRLVEDRKTVAVKTVTGSTADPQALAKMLTATIVALAVSLRP
jgi:translation elongation factor EF-1alpha